MPIPDSLLPTLKTCWFMSDEVCDFEPCPIYYFS